MSTGSTTIIIGYVDGTPLETTVAVDLLVDGAVAGTANPDANGNLDFAVAIPAGSAAALRLHADPLPA